MPEAGAVSQERQQEAQSELPRELRHYLTVETDQWGAEHIVCLKCKRRFFTLRDAAIHLLRVHGVRVAQKYSGQA